MSNSLKDLIEIIDKMKERLGKSEEEQKQEIRDYYKSENAYIIFSIQLSSLKHRLNKVDLPITNEEEFEKFMNGWKLKMDANPPELLVKSQDFINKFLKDFLEFIKQEKEKEKKS